LFYEESKINMIRSNGAYWADGGIVSTSDEMISFLRALNEGRIIKKKTLELMHNWLNYVSRLNMVMGQCISIYLIL